MQLHRRTYILIFSFFFIALVLWAPANAYAMGKSTISLKLSTGKKVTVNYIYFHPSENVELKPVLAQNKVGKTESLAGMAKRVGAVAAINGTFFNAYDQNDLLPQGGIMIDRELTHLMGSEVAMGITSTNELKFGKASQFKILGGINGFNDWPYNWYAWGVNHFTKDPASIMIYTPLYKNSSLAIPGFTFVTVQGGVVSEIKKDQTSIPANGFVIAFGSGSTNEEQIEKFHVGDNVQYEVEFPENLEDVIHMISVGPKLVTAGKKDIDFKRDKITDPKMTKNAGLRSLIGKKADGTILMGTVSYATIPELAEVALKLGLVEAMNLDGGASSGLYYQGKYLTSPGRNLSNALVLIPKQRGPRIVLNGEEIFIKGAEAFMAKGTTMVPVRGVFEALGVEVNWVDSMQTVVARRLDTEIRLTLGSKVATVNGEERELLEAPVKKGGRVYIPLRFVSEALGANVSWDQKRNTVLIRSEITTADAHFAKAKNFLQMNDIKEAQAQLELAVRLKPTMSAAWFELGKLYQDQEEYEKAVDAYQQVDTVEAQMRLGWYAYENEDFQTAILAFQRVLELDPNEANAHYGLGSVYMHWKVQEYDLAKEHLRKAMELAPESDIAKKAEEALHQL